MRSIISLRLDLLRGFLISFLGQFIRIVAGTNSTWIMTTPAIKITVSALVHSPIEKVWACWNEPQHMMQWMHASDDWHCPAATNDLRIGGHFVATMAAKDGSVSFDFIGKYDEIVEHRRILYHGEDGRVVEVLFEAQENGVLVTETFDAETINPVDMQQAGWQAILNNFKQYTES